MKTPKTEEVEFLNVRAVQLVGGATSNILRDLAIVSLLYDSGARVSELCGMAVGGLARSRPHTAKVLGKGSKARVIPVSNQLGEMLARYITSVRPCVTQTDPLFVNRRGNPLGRVGVAHVLQKSVTAVHGVTQRKPPRERIPKSCVTPKPCIS